MSDKFVVSERNGGVVTLTIARPERKNALHPAAHLQLDAALDAAASDPETRVVVLTGTGDAFCAGYDLRDNLETGVMWLPETGFGGLTRRTNYPVPLIAAVNGAALGGGFEMALACDLIIAASNAVFALPEPKVGWVAAGGGVQRLPRAIGLQRAMGMILTGRSVSAAEGRELGFVNEVVEPDALITTVGRWAAEIVACAPLAIHGSRALAWAAFDAPGLAAALDAEHHPAVARVMQSEDALEGKRAFAERRRPVWTGK